MDVVCNSIFVITFTITVLSKGYRMMSYDSTQIYSMLCNQESVWGELPETHSYCLSRPAEKNKRFRMWWRQTHRAVISTSCGNIRIGEEKKLSTEVASHSKHFKANFFILCVKMNQCCFHGNGWTQHTITCHTLIHNRTKCLKLMKTILSAISMLCFWINNSTINWFEFDLTLIKKLFQHFYDRGDASSCSLSHLQLPQDVWAPRRLRVAGESKSSWADWTTAADWSWVSSECVYE